MGVVDLGVKELVDPNRVVVLETRRAKYDPSPHLGVLTRDDAVKGDDETVLVSDRRTHEETSSIGL